LHLIALTRGNHGEGKEEAVGVGVVEGRCEESAGIREGKALGYADSEKIEADAGSCLPEGDEIGRETSVGPQ